MQKRIFNTTGFCNPEKHYTINPLRGKGDEIEALIRDELYFVIHAPRQSGKTTLLHSIVKKINSEGKYVSLVFSVERAGYRSITIQEANKTIINAIHQMAKHFLEEQFFPPNPDSYNDKTFHNYLSDWASGLTKSLIVFIDEIDSLYDDILVSILRQLRDGFQLRPHSFPGSVALVGLRDVREYKSRVRESDNSVGSGSPFNIKAESFKLENFSKEEVTALYKQFTDETGQEFPPDVVDLIYEYTAGQPWLTNAVAREITDKILKKNYKAKITKEIAETAKENLIVRRDTHLDSLTDKLKEPRIKPIIEAIISGNSPLTDSYDDDLQYAIDLGIISRSKQGIVISNRIYNEIIPRILNLKWQDSLLPVIDEIWFIENERLQMDSLLKEFQEFYREHSESWIDQFSFKEAGKQLLLMAFLQRVMNGGGKIQREMALGSQRCDLAVFYNDDCFAIETKIKKGKQYTERGLRQLSSYMDKLGQKHGYLILFEPKNSKEIPWEKRLKWSETEYEHLGVKRKITIVEM